MKMNVNNHAHANESDVPKSAVALPHDGPAENQHNQFVDDSITQYSKSTL